MNTINEMTKIVMLKPMEAEKLLRWNSPERIVFEDVNTICKEVGRSCTVGYMMDRIQVELSEYQAQLPILASLGYIKIVADDHIRTSCKEMFLDYFNNFLTIPTFARCYGISETFAQALINEGRDLHEKSVAEMKKVSA